MVDVTDEAQYISELVRRLRDENARLQARVEEAEADVRRWKKAKGESDSVIRRIVALVPRDAEQEDIFAAVERTVAERDKVEALAERRKKALDKGFPESLAHRADGERECHYCYSLVSLGPHKPECPRAALAQGENAPARDG